MISWVSGILKRTVELITTLFFFTLSKILNPTTIFITVVIIWYHHHCILCGILEKRQYWPQKVNVYTKDKENNARKKQMLWGVNADPELADAALLVATCRCVCKSSCDSDRAWSLCSNMSISTLMDFPGKEWGERSGAWLEEGSGKETHPWRLFSLLTSCTALTVPEGEWTSLSF